MIDDAEVREGINLPEGSHFDKLVYTNNDVWVLTYVQSSTGDKLTLYCDSYETAKGVENDLKKFRPLVYHSYMINHFAIYKGVKNK